MNRGKGNQNVQSIVLLKVKSKDHSSAQPTRRYWQIEIYMEVGFILIHSIYSYNGGGYKSVYQGGGYKSVYKGKGYNQSRDGLRAGETWTGCRRG